MTVLARHSIHVVRQTFDELPKSAEVNSASRVLKIKHPVMDQIVEISVVYFRTGYPSTDYRTKTRFDVRLLLERSRAMKFPAIQLQLAGSRKLQRNRESLNRSSLITLVWMVRIP